MNKELHNKLKLQTINVNEIFSDEDISPGKLFVKLYGELYDKCSYYHRANLKLFLKKLKEELNIDETSFFAQDLVAHSKKLTVNYDYFYSALVILSEKNILYISDSKLEFYYSPEVDKKIIYDVLNIAKSCKKTKKHKQKFYMIAEDRHAYLGFELRRFKIKAQSVDIENNYNDDFKQVDETTREFLIKKKANGLVLLHGKYGTGKTSYIRHLMRSVNKRFIFLPVNMMESISSPSFIPFISQYKESILILEDCETILKQRDSNDTDNSLVNLLNLGDGLLSDALSIKIICTFNTDLKNIDQAILRKGRLVTQYEFKELTLDKTIKLSEKLGIEQKPKQPKTLAEIYNASDNEEINAFQKNKIGF